MNWKLASSSTQLEKFRSKVNGLFSGFNMPREIQYYFTVAKVAFELAETYPERANLINEYITFLSIVLNCVEYNNKMNPGMFLKENLEKIKKIPWSSYKNGVNLNREERPELNQQVIEKWNFEESNNKLYVLVPLTIPGIGKTYLTKFLKEAIKANTEMDYYEVSSDKIRREDMEKYIRTQKNSTLEIAFEKTGKQYGLNFYRKIDLILKGIKNNSKKTIILFIDKNHPPNSLTKTVQTFREFKMNNRELKIMGIIPKSLHPFNYQGKFLTFSLNTIINCIKRILARENHETLNGTAEKKIGVMSLFLGLFKGFNLRTKEFTKNGLDGKIEVPFVCEDLISDSKYPRKLPTVI